MRKIGLIGGMSWYSTEFYYRRINKQVQRRANAMCSAPMILDNLNFCDLAKATTDQDWDRVAEVLVASAKRLEAGGATAILIGANSMHKVHDRVSAAVKVPVLHIADAVGQKMKADGVESAALIGTRHYTATDGRRAQQSLFRLARSDGRQIARSGRSQYSDIRGEIRPSRV